MSKEYGYIGKEVEQDFRSNSGIFTPQDIIELDQENKWTNFNHQSTLSIEGFGGINISFLRKEKKNGNFIKKY